MQQSNSTFTTQEIKIIIEDLLTILYDNKMLTLQAIEQLYVAPECSCGIGLGNQDCYCDSKWHTKGGFLPYQGKPSDSFKQLQDIVIDDYIEYRNSQVNNH